MYELESSNTIMSEATASDEVGEGKGWADAAELLCEQWYDIEFELNAIDERNRCGIEGC
jgi:hypothetical protein